MSKKISLEPTAAMVMHMAEPLRKKSIIFDNFLSKIDIGSADTYINLLKSKNLMVLAQEITCNRKFKIKYELEQFITKNKNYKINLFSLAAGKSPVFLEIFNDNFSENTKFYELDISPFDEKILIYKDIVPNFENFFEFIEVDLVSDQFREKIKNLNIYNDKNIFVMEGLTHYISSEAIIKILKNIKEISNESQILIEYAPPIDTIQKDIIVPVREIFTLMENHFFNQGMHKYSYTDFEEFFQKIGGLATKKFTMKLMEKERTDKTEFFDSTLSGPVEIMEGII
jgi:hypothetical protein